MTDNNSQDSVVTKPAEAPPEYDEMRNIANLRQHLWYIILNVVLMVMFLATALFSALGKNLLQNYSLPLYAPPLAMLIEISLLLALGYCQQTYTKRFRIAILIAGIITMLEAGLLFYYANPDLY